MKTIIYGRVSTQIQDFNRQIDELKSYAATQSWSVDAIFAEKISGANESSGTGSSTLKSEPMYLSPCPPRRYPNWISPRYHDRYGIYSLILRLDFYHNFFCKCI